MRKFRDKIAIGRILRKFRHNSKGIYRTFLPISLHRVDMETFCPIRVKSLLASTLDNDYMIWETLKKLPLQLLNWLLKTFFPDWFYCQIWKWGDVELAARNKILDNSKKTKNIRLCSNVILKSREIIFFLLNKNYGGLYLEDSISISLSIRDFKQIYTVLFAFFLTRLKTNDLKEEIHILFPGEESLFENLIMEIQEQCSDEKGEAILAWSHISNIIGNDRSSADELWCGSFVLFSEKASKELHDRWG